MKSVTDIIEDFIMSNLDVDNFIEISRNDLAKYFSCVPSQINYVLNTRFTTNRGFVVESQRGGAGYIKVTRLKNDNQNFFNNALKIVNQPISSLEANQLLDHMTERELLTKKEESLIKATISPKALNNPINMDNMLRANILNRVIIELMKQENLK